jgi:predicted anti-sigma-YlaC factor YlaD
MHRECDRARQWASLELDGELSEFEHVLLEGHLAGCASCSAFRADIVGATRELRAAPLEPYLETIQLRRIRRARLRFAPAAAALAVAAVGLGSIIASVQVRAPQAGNGAHSDSGEVSLSGRPNGGVAPAAVKSGDAINMRAVRRLDRTPSAVAARPPSDLPGGPVIDKK